MSTMEKIDTNKVKITFSVDAETFEKGMQYSYNQNKGKISVQGFRKGKAPRKLIEAQYGKGVFYDDAINYVLPTAYEAAVKENELEVVSRPEIDITKIDENEGVEFTAEVFVKPEVKLGEYKGLKYTKLEVEPTDADIEAELKKEQEKNARISPVTDRAVADGDIATIDFKGFVDGEAFEGGEAKDYDLEIGSHSFIDNFEEQLIGKNIGDDVKVEVTFPEEYHQESLAGKPATFEVQIKEIKAKELPELNDEFVSDTTEFETLEEYKNDIAGKLIVEKTQRANDAKENQLIEALIDCCEMEVPDVMIENDVQLKIDDFARNIQAQGLSIDDYLKYMGQDLEAMKAAYRPMSTRQVKARLALEAVAKAENLEAGQEAIDAEVEKIAKTYGMEADKLKSVLRPEDIENISKDVKVQAALKFIADNGVAEEPKTEE